MQFKKYSSIENTYRQTHINKIIKYGLTGGEWVVTEKVHGACTSVAYDGKLMQFGKRTAFVGEGNKIEGDKYWTSGSNFYDWQGALERDLVLSKVEKIYNALKTTDEDEIIVYGELFGGSYPNIKSNMKPVQKGVFYSPDQHFYAFDIRHNGHFIDYYTFETMCENANLLYAKSLMIGSLEECMKYPNDGQSTIPHCFNLPKLDNNIMEGVVIKPIEAKYFPNGERVILKNKNDKFLEKTGGKHKKHKLPTLKIELSKECESYLENLLTYINHNRLKNVISHVGDTITDKDFGKLLGMLMSDAIEDFLKDNEGFKSLENNERNAINKQANKYAQQMIRKEFLNIIDGNF